MTSVADSVISSNRWDWRRHTQICLLGLALISALGASPVLSQPVAILGGTIIDGNGGQPVKDGVIVVDGGRIVALGNNSTPIPSQARRISAAGKYVIPGLMDANVHLVSDYFPLTLVRYENRYDELAVEAAQVALKSGVTTLFDSWGPRSALVRARNLINEGRVPGSRVYLAGNIVGLDGPLSADFVPPQNVGLPPSFIDRVNAQWRENVGPELQWMSPEQVRGEMRKYVSKGIDFVKYAVTGHGQPSFIQFSPRVQQVIVEEARRAHLPVQTHTTTVEGLNLAVQMGVDLMQHCEITGPQPIPPETVALIAQRHIPCAFVAMTDKEMAWHRAKTQGSYEKMVNVDTRDRNERALLRAGAVIVLSTDGGVFSSDTLSIAGWSEDSLLQFGRGCFNWLRAVEQKGMKPMDALMAATRNIARAYKIDKDLGTLEKGKIADLLILDKNPLDSAANYRTITLVMKEGEIIDRDALPTHALLTAPADVPGTAAR